MPPPIPQVLHHPPLTLHRQDWRGWALLGLGLVALAGLFSEALARLTQLWGTQPEYSFGYLIPVISAFLVWQRKNDLARLHFTGSWAGVALVAVGLACWGLGHLSTLDTLGYYGFALVVMGLAWSYVGTGGMRLLWVAAALLFFMVPLPNYLLRELSSALQLLSSKLGVSFIRLCGVSVYLEGNVIDLGSMKLQVAEACDGLRYLFPLMTLSFIMAYFYRAPFWRRVLVFLSAIPISVFMNSLRIGLIGVTVDRWGKRMAEGLLHDMEGWVIFMLSTALLMAEVWLLSWLSGDRRALREVFSVDLPAPMPRQATVRYRALPASALAAVALLSVVALTARALPDITHVIPPRPAMTNFPLSFAGWRGQSERLDPLHLEQLKLADYVLATYADAGGRGVNLYVSYYDIQAKGNTAHSPRDCIPGDGWEIQSLDRYDLPNMTVKDTPFRINRAVIQKGETRQLVYYWFQQRGRIIAGEYAVKLSLFHDLITLRRSDGAMVRLVTHMPRAEGPSAADQRLQAFARAAYPLLRQYIPE